ncbi:hypothetical protein BDN67DRAFT_970781 [Paxillus ammoniavirescens]|nr:hypothetical protein BDN67DRAFT_970781 [Paxillus ammoniavirescens]
MSTPFIAARYLGPALVIGYGLCISCNFRKVLGISTLLFLPRRFYSEFLGETTDALLCPNSLRGGGSSASW